MRQVMILEKSDLQRLKSGETLSITTPAGVIDFALEGGKPKEARGNGWAQKIKDWVNLDDNSPTEITVADVTRQFPELAVNHARLLLEKLAKDKELKKVKKDGKVVYK
jgi:hypothetical protein